MPCKTTPTHFLHNFLSIPRISDLLRSRYFKYSHSTFTSRPQSYWPGAILNSFSNNVYLPLTSLYSDHSTYFTKFSICPFPPSTTPLSVSFTSRFLISNKAGIRGEDREKLILDINRSVDYSPNSLFFFTDGSATLSSEFLPFGRSTQRRYRNTTGSAVIMYFRGKSIGMRRDRHSPSSTAFDAELFAIHKALQMAQSRLSFSSSNSTPNINKVIIYTDSSSSLQLLSTNPSKFLHHPLYVQIFELVTSLLTDFPTLAINLNWCPGHKGVIGNEEADLQAGKACASRIPTSTPITASFCSLISTKDLLDNCIYYWEAYKEIPGGFSPGFQALFPPTLKVKSLYKELLNDRSLCSRFVRIATHHCFCGAYYKRFHIPEDFSCPCGTTRNQDVDHLLYRCPLIVPSLIPIEWSFPHTPWVDPLFSTKFGLRLLIPFLKSNSIGLKPPVHV